MADEQLTYRDAGVDIGGAERALRAVLPSIQATYTEDVLAGVGGFGGLFRANFEGMERPVLVSSIDGVGTKTKVAAMAGQFGGLGADIVNHCVNDILCQGARPLFFMDYFASARLEGEVFAAVIESAAAACKACGTALLGGETAEMPGVYHDGEIDLVGSIVGVVDSELRFPRGKILPGDAVIGIASDGLHTNGYTLARRALFEHGGLSVRDELAGIEGTLGEALLRPHKCYFGTVHPMLQSINGVRGIAHITGGGLHGNVPRAMHANVQAVIDRRSWSPPPLFKLIQETGQINDQEMFTTFNMGIGMVLVVAKDVAGDVVDALNGAGEAAAKIGYIQSGANDVQII